ncbi:MAG: toll/interleukin-1 receptor domain-containing protein [Phaeobacter italicus]
MSALPFLADRIDAPLAQSFDVFLCHSTHDAALVSWVFHHLTRKRLSVYIDWVADRAADGAPDHETLAPLLKQRMRRAKRLLYLRTPNGDLSRWCAWEIGYFDALHPNQVFVADLTHAPRANFLRHYPTWPHPLPMPVSAGSLTPCPTKTTACYTSTASTRPWTGSTRPWTGSPRKPLS